MYTKSMYTVYNTMYTKKVCRVMYQFNDNLLCIEYTRWSQQSTEYVTKLYYTIIMKQLEISQIDMNQKLLNWFALFPDKSHNLQILYELYFLVKKYKLILYKICFNSYIFNW